MFGHISRKFFEGSGLFIRCDFHQTAIAGKGSCRRHFIFGEHIDAAAFINSRGIRPVPGARLQTGHTGHNPIGDFGHRLQAVAIIVDDDPVAIGNTAPKGIVALLL